MSTYSLRIPDDLMEEAKKLAARNDTSLNQFFLAAIAERVGTERTKRVFERMAAKADEQTFQAILNRVPAAPIPPSDTLPE
ncbi:MAG: hypothetical protein QUV20_13080 [Oceanibaculum nanhaiense]|uniref:hypothetical protein n=1 Tax=Oceanibaculum nanhaiense TaxID=1909734 RepID=UPI0025A398D8|nr:hypothetical protein [Oceanibaculum nanhaiense]MDM7947255.1 hypothetical protein [Oceanibaculum nanhaiense]